jgi:hypothetical protein
MTCYLTYLKDTIGNNYLGIKFDNSIVEPFLNKLKDVLSEDDYEIYTSNQQKRDHGSYHMTVINVMDYNRLSKEMGISNFVNSLESSFDYVIDDLQLLGLGTANKNENTAYFVVGKSEKLQAIRQRYSLPEHDMHITLGFKWKDVFGVRKNEVMDIKSKFLHILKQEFYKKENFNFVKDISNFEESRDSEIIPISISDEHLKVLCGDVIMDIGYLESENKLFIFTKYKKSSEVSRLPMTEILRILKINN